MSGRVSFRSRLGEVVFRLVHRTGLLRLGVYLVRKLGGGGVRVLCYHRIAEDPRPDDLSPDRFRAHLAHLGRHYSFLPAADLVTGLRDGKDLPRNGIVITLDDGYRDFPEETLKDLARTRATVFVISGDLPGRGRFPADDRASDLLDATDLKNLAASGVTIGSHTRTHPRLVDTPREVTAGELCGSMEDIARAIDRAPELLAYPWGLATDEVAQAATGAGYRGGFVTGGGAVRADTDPMRIPRIHVPGNASVARIACEAAGFVAWLRGRR